MPFKWELVADVSKVIKGTADVEQAIDSVADTLDKLGSETGATADQAADKLSSEFKQAFDKVQTDAKTTGDTVGSRMKQGTEKASEGTHALKENAAQNAKEIAASFDGSAQSIADGFQGLAAEALEGFGPAGLAAGVAVAAGIGLASTSLGKADEEAKQTKADTLELGKALATAASRTEALADAVADAMSESVKNPQNIVDALLGADGTDRLTLYSDVIRNAGLSYSDVIAAMKGDDEAYARVTQQAWAKSDAAHQESTINFMADLDKRNQATKDAQVWADEYARSGVANQQKVIEAQQAATQAAQDWSDSLTDNLSVSDEGLDSFVRGAGVKLKDWNKKLQEAAQQGTLDVDAWAKEVQRRASENKLILNFTADVDTKLSPEALANFEKLPTDTQAAIARAYKQGDHKKILQTLEAEAKVTKVDVDTSAVKPQAVEIPATVVQTGVPKDVRVASTAGQVEANRASNVIEFKTKIDADELQRQVNRAAASITPPTITVKLKVPKEVP